MNKENAAPGGRPTASRSLVSNVEGSKMDIMKRADYWTQNAVRLQAELAAAGVEPSASDEVIATNAGGWFAALGDNTKTAIISAMRSLAAI